MKVSVNSFYNVYKIYRFLENGIKAVFGKYKTVNYSSIESLSTFKLVGSYRITTSYKLTSKMKINLFSIHFTRDK